MGKLPDDGGSTSSQRDGGGALLQGNGTTPTPLLTSKWMVSPKLRSACYSQTDSWISSLVGVVVEREDVGC